jgi:hypothetical protein
MDIPPLLEPGEISRTQPRQRRDILTPEPRRSTPKRLNESDHVRGDPGPAALEEMCQLFALLRARHKSAPGLTGEPQIK